MPVVTIAIPTFNRSALLRRALLSAVSQTFEGEMEILVVENPSTETLSGVPTDAELLCGELADSRIRYIRNAGNLGMVGNWNRCLELAGGRWVVVLHDDDWLSPYHIELSLAMADAHPELRLVGCEGIIEREGTVFRSDLRPTSPVRAFRLSLFHFLLGNPFFAPGVMMDKETANALGGFDPAWFPTMDHLFWLRFCERCPCARIQLPLLHYYIGDNASLQSNVLIGYVLNDWRQRTAFLTRHFPRTAILRWYSRIKVYRERAFVQHLFNMKVNSEGMFEQLAKMGWRPVSPYLRWTYYPIRAALEIISILCAERLDCKVATDTGHHR
jgi:glycosyltransferase involved in cell wall biosynthesis